MSGDEKRVVLVKPGDILVFANVRLQPEDLTDVLPKFKEAIGLDHIVFFEDDISIDVITAEQINAALAAVRSSDG